MSPTATKSVKTRIKLPTVPTLQVRLLLPRNYKKSGLLVKLNSIVAKSA